MTARSRRTSLVALTLTAVLGALLLPGTAAIATLPPQGIHGTLTGDGGGLGPVAIFVEPLDPSTPMYGDRLVMSGDYTPGDCMSPCVSYEQAPDGGYDIPLVPGKYWVRFSSPGWALQWWGGSSDRDGTEITITDNTSLTENVVFEHGGSITGTINQAATATGADATFVEAWVADASFPGGYFQMTRSWAAENGEFVLPNLPDADYLVHAVNEARNVEGWWHGTTTADSGPVTITGGATVPGIAPDLQPFGTISGRVTSAADGTGVSGMEVEGFRIVAPGRWRQDNAYTTTGPDGTYTLPARAGTYRVAFYGATDLKPEFWGNASTVQAGAETSVLLGADTPGIDAALEPVALVAKTAPHISGTQKVGSTLTAAVGSWYPTPTSYSYRWTTGGVVRSTAKTYVPRSADLGHHVTLRVTAQRAGYESTLRSVMSGPIALGELRLTSAAAINGTPRVGGYLRAVAPRTSPSSAVAYRWYRDGHRLYGRTDPTYTMVAADRGHRISVHMSLTRTGYETLVRGAQTSAVVH